MCHVTIHRSFFIWRPNWGQYFIFVYQRKGVVIFVFWREKIFTKKKNVHNFFLFSDLRWRKNVTDNGHFRWRNRSAFFISRFYSSDQLSGLFQLYGSRSKGWVFVRQKMDNTEKTQSWTGAETWLERLLVNIILTQI